MIVTSCYFQYTFHFRVQGKLDAHTSRACARGIYAWRISAFIDTISNML